MHNLFHQNGKFSFLFSHKPRGGYDMLSQTTIVFAQGKRAGLQIQAVTKKNEAANF